MKQSLHYWEEAWHRGWRASTSRLASRHPSLLHSCHFECRWASGDSAPCHLEFATSADLDPEGVETSTYFNDFQCAFFHLPYLSFFNPIGLWSQSENSAKLGIVKSPSKINPNPTTAGELCHWTISSSMWPSNILRLCTATVPVPTCWLRQAKGLHLH